MKKKGSPVHVAPAYAGSGEGSDHFGSYVCSLSLHFYKRLFSGLEPMTSWSQGNNFTAMPGLPFYLKMKILIIDWKLLNQLQVLHIEFLFRN
jgi:hypothetical protein